MQYKVWMVCGGKRTSFPHLLIMPILWARNQGGLTLYAQGGKFAIKNHNRDEMILDINLRVGRLSMLFNEFFCLKYIKRLFQSVAWWRLSSNRQHNCVHLCTTSLNPSPCTLQMKKQRGSRNNCEKSVFHWCKTYLNFVVHQLKSSQLCPILSYIPYPNPWKLQITILQKYLQQSFHMLPSLIRDFWYTEDDRQVCLVTCFGRGRLMCGKDWRKKPQRFGKFGASNW